MAYQMKKIFLPLLSFFIILLSLFSAQGENQKSQEVKLTIDKIMKGPELMGSEPSNIMWSVDGKRLYFRWKKPGEKSVEFFAVTKQDLTLPI